MKIQDQINLASRKLASETARLGYKHPQRLNTLAVLRELKAEQKRRLK